MVWIKRNLVFVIIVAVGLLLTGFCAFLLYRSLNANAGFGEEYKSTLANLQALQDKNPYPNAANIDAAKGDQTRVRQFLVDFRQRFAPFPTPPYEDEKGFKTYLEQSLYRFHAEATNAGVLLPDSYFFSWSALMGKLTYSPDSIAPWMQQLQEMNTILDILYGAKINALDSLQRVPVSADDTGGGGSDYLQAVSVTNVWGVVTPYKISFRCFSAELAGVLEGFASSSNCFIIKNIDVSPSKAPLPVVIAVPPPGQAPAPVYYTPPVQNPYVTQNRGGPIPGFRPAPVRMAAPVAGTVPVVSTAPVTVLSENPLFVSIAVDVVKLKAADH